MAIYRSWPDLMHDYRSNSSRSFHVVDVTLLQHEFRPNIYDVLVATFRILDL